MNKIYRITRIFWGGIMVGAFVLAGCQSEPQEKTLTKEEMVQRGQYLVKIGVCNDCHSPKIFTPDGPVPDETRLLSGHPADSELPEFDPNMVGEGKWVLFSPHFTAGVGPWGISFAANLTPDRISGLGTWTEETFINTMRSGKHMGEGRPILPPMPWMYYSNASDDDLKAIFAYLQSLKPVKNIVPQPIPPAELGIN